VQTAGKNSRRRRRIFRIVAVLGALLALAVVLEIGLRLFSDKGRSFVRRDDHVGRTLLPHLDTGIWVGEAGRKVHVRTNRDGYRTPERPLDKPAGIRRLAVLGDSYVAAAAVDQKDMMTTRLQQHLGDSWEVLNFGHSGYSTAQCLQTWRHYAKPYAPDLVLYVFTLSNDVKGNYAGTDHASAARRPYFELGPSGKLTLRGISSSRNALSRYVNRSHLYVWQKGIVNRLVARIRPEAVGTWGHHVLNTSPAPEFEHAWKVTEALFAELRREVEATGARFVLTDVPHIAQYDTGERAYLTDLLGPEKSKTLDVTLGERKLTEVALRLDMPRISFLDAYRASCAAGTKVDFKHGHWNEEGNKIAADEIHRQLAEHAWLE